LMDTSFMDDTILCQWIKSNDRSNILIEWEKMNEI
jgi:hypothetical protein